MGDQLGEAGEASLHAIGERPGDEDALHDWLVRNLGLSVPRRAVCAGHDAPWEYVRSAFFETSGDLIVWAPRGGGKTRLGAAVTLLDLLFKPGCQVRILGGSLEQSLRMWEHLWPDVQRLAGRMLPKRGGRFGRINLSNGSGAGVLAQSQRAVRGVRVQKLRCDEVDQFKPEIWEAAQLVTRSRPNARGTLEAISTMHTPGGIMQQLVERAADGGSTRVIRWCLMEVLERCPPQRPCESCALWGECQGRAKTQCDGFFSIDDAIALKQRVSPETWEAEMLCLKPGKRDAFFGHFSSEVHVTPAAAGAPGSPWLAMDFGFRDPFVCLRIIDGQDGVVRVTDEYVQSQRIFDEHLAELDRRGWGVSHEVACDPAGNARNDQTALSNVQLLRRRGYHVHCRRSQVIQGLELIRAALRSATGRVSLLVHPRCHRLIRALQELHYAPGGGELPATHDQHDHLIDALRYFFINRQRQGTARSGRY